MKMTELETENIRLKTSLKDNPDLVKKLKEQLDEKTKDLKNLEIFHSDTASALDKLKNQEKLWKKEKAVMEQRK